MEQIDLSHTIKSDMPVYPGTPKPVFSRAVSIEEDGFLEQMVSMTTHTGTHIDAPAHILTAGKTLDSLPLSRFSGMATVLDLSAPGIKKISRLDLKKYEKEFRELDFILFYTGWEKKWGLPAYFEPHPALDNSAAEWISTFGIKGVGIDALSIERLNASPLRVHEILLSDEIIIIENLCRLERLAGCRFRFYAFPLKIENTDGSPVRAVAEI